MCGLRNRFLGFLDRFYRGQQPVLPYKLNKAAWSHCSKGFKFTLEMCLIGVGEELDKFGVIPIRHF